MFYGLRPHKTWLMKNQNEEKNNENGSDNNQKQDDIVYEEEDTGGFFKKIDPIKKMREGLRQCQKEKGDYLIGWQRAQADLINYKKRQEERFTDMQKLMNGRLIVELLSVLDSFNGAPVRDASQSDAGGPEINGLREIRDQFWEILKKYGLEEIKCLGTKFNPELHEAIMSVESVEGEDDIIVEEFQKGYLLNGKVIRPSRVKIVKNI